jgi:CheY-like chemotaxis protein
MVRAMANHRIDLLILDVIPPAEDGLSLCHKVRAESQMPIIQRYLPGIPANKGCLDFWRAMPDDDEHYLSTP